MIVSPLWLQACQYSMIRVPGSWKCARHMACCVEYEGQTFLCRVIPMRGVTVWLEFQQTVVLPPAEARRLMSQDFTLPEVHSVEVIGVEKHGRGLRYRPVRDSDVCTADCTTFSIRCPTSIYVGKSVKLNGPRFDARATVEMLAAALSGKYIAVGSMLKTTTGKYVVADLGLKFGYRGVALVGANARFHLNNSSLRSTEVLCNRHVLVGLHQERRELVELVKTVAGLPGTVTGVFVRGPPGCGVHSLVEHCVCASSDVTVARWGIDFCASSVRQSVRTRVVAVMVDPAEKYFPEGDVGRSKMSLRRLERDVLLLGISGNGCPFSVVIVAVTHQYGGLCDCEIMSACFSKHIVLGRPDVELRAALIAHVRGGDIGDWREMARLLVGSTSQQVLEVARRDAKVPLPSFQKMKWSAIGGLEAVKFRLRRALILPQMHPDLFERFHLAPPKGILLYGPPGCAKTSLVRALCSEGRFSLIYLDAASIISAYVGESEQMLRDAFARAAQQSPCVVFFDEVEILGGKREAGEHDAGQTRLLSTLLTEMDGFSATRGVCFIGATNLPHLIDPALLRPGRFDYLVDVPLPTEEDRLEIARLLLRKTAAAVETIARCTDGFSGADVKALCSEGMLELLHGEAELPQRISDEAYMTDFMIQKARTFKRCTFNSVALDAFSREYGALHGNQATDRVG